MKFLPVAFLLILGFCAAHAAGADTFKSAATVAIAETGPFVEGGREFDVMGGYFVSPIFGGHHRTRLNYVQGDLTLGWMLTSPSPLWGQNWLRGNWEVLGNAFGAVSTKGPSGFWAGGRLLMRYNFVQPQSKWVPFIQLGAGMLGDNVYEHRDQGLIGSGVEFTLVADAGLRYFITPKCAAVFMLDFEHISNANTASRNIGVNAGGGTLGLGFFF